MAFTALTLFLDVTGRGDWWLFFGAMLAVFALHNLLQDKEFKTSTFLWLAWFRFLAPVVFVVQSSQRMGIALCPAGSLYAGFRLFGYLDSKGLLVMPRRQSMTFRATDFLMPLFSAIAMFDYPEAMGFRCMVFYYAALAFCRIGGAKYFEPVRGGAKNSNNENMCGLAGFIALAGSASLEADGMRMADAIAHRGPDDFGVWSDATAGVCLAHRRLSIIDRSIAGHQPMRSISGRFVLVFNGEV